MCGILQGSVLGPILFVLYVIDLILLVESHGLLAHLYVDDTQVCSSCRNLWTSATLLVCQFTPCTFCPQCWTFCPLDVSPSGQFTTKTFCHLDILPPGRFTIWTICPHTMDSSPYNMILNENIMLPSLFLCISVLMNTKLQT